MTYPYVNYCSHNRHSVRETKKTSEQSNSERKRGCAGIFVGIIRFRLGALCVQRQIQRLFEVGDGTWRSRFRCAALEVDPLGQDEGAEVGDPATTASGKSEIVSRY